MNGHVWFEGGFTRAESLTASALERAWRYGDGGFETMLYHRGKIPLLSYHLQRARKHTDACSATLSLPSEKELTEIIGDLAEKNDVKKSGRVRMTWCRKPGGLYRPETADTSLLVELHAFYPEDVKRKLHALFYTDQPLAAGTLSAFKKLSASVYVQASVFAADMGADDALLGNTHGRWAEFTSSNLLLRHGDSFSAPPASEGAVEGILLNRLEEWLPQWGFSFNRKQVTTEDLREADEIFSINALRGFCRVQVKDFASGTTSFFETLQENLDKELGLLP
jgi:branched-chain amino acid aminotransferase